MIQLKEIDSYKAYGKVLSISNGIIEAYVTLDVGPRVIRFGYIGGQNILNSNREEFSPKDDEEFQAFFGKGKKWENFGGHRLWISPEAYPDTYYPDGDPITYEATEFGAIFTPAKEIENSVAKQIEIRMDPDDANLQVIMHAENIGNKPLDFAMWSISVAEKGGTLIVPMNDHDTGLLANRTVSIWPYTDMSDKRIHWGKKYLTLHQNPNATEPIKLGFDLHHSTVYYILGEDVFSKSYTSYHPDAVYPDNGCSFETYTNEYFLEIESLGALKTVMPGEKAVHTERWSLYKKPCEVDTESDASIDNMINNL